MFCKHFKGERKGICTFLIPGVTFDVNNLELRISVSVGNSLISATVQCSSRSKLITFLPKPHDCASIALQVIDAYMETLMILARPSYRVLALPIQLALQWNFSMTRHSITDYLYENVSRGLLSYNVVYVEFSMLLNS